MAQNTVPVRVGLLELLKGCTSTQFVIPAYQRNYTWTANREVKQLFEDIEAVLDGTHSKHFIGIMIYLEQSVTPFLSERSVIDGQQRLTTVFLTMYAIKELMVEQGMNEEALDLEYVYLVNQYRNTKKYKLKPLVADDTVYQKIVNEDFKSITERKSNVFVNFVYIKSRLKEFMTKYSLNEILAAMNKLYIVCVPIAEDDYPQKIFESINATGAKLTASDLIRNFILMTIKSDLQDEYYDKYWRKIEELVDTDSKNLEAFFRFFLMAKCRSLINKNGVYRAFTQWYDENKKELEVKEICCELVRYAQYHNELYKAPVESLETELRVPIREMRRNISDMPTPMLLELYAIHKQEVVSGVTTITSKQFAEILTILNSYLMRRSLCGLDTSDISRYFPDLLKDLLNECQGDYRNIVEIFKRFLINRNKGNLRVMPDDKQLFERIYHANMYSLRNWVNAFFTKLESENNPAPVDFSKLSIEHLMPQKPTMNWYSTLGVTKEIYEENVHRLGNLTLAAKSDNSRMSNNVWEYKNSVLASTNHLKINLPLLDKKQWTIDEIDRRTKMLIKEIARLYPYYEAKDSDVNKIPVYIQNDEIFALANYYPDSKSLEVESDSQLFSGLSEEFQDPQIEELRMELIDQEILAEKNGKLVFVQDYTFDSKKVNALTLAASLILQESENGWDCWKMENGGFIREYFEKEKQKVHQQMPKSLRSEATSSMPASEINETTVHSYGKDIFLTDKKVDWSLFTVGLTFPVKTFSLIQNLTGGRIEIGEQRNVRVEVNGVKYEAVIKHYTTGGETRSIQEVMQIRYNANSPLAAKLQEIYQEQYLELLHKRKCKAEGLPCTERGEVAWMNIYAKQEPNVFVFDCSK